MHTSSPFVRSFLSLKWKILLVVSTVLVLVNSGMAYLAFLKTASQYDAELQHIRVVQERELEDAFFSAFEALTTFAYFIPKLSGDLDTREVVKPGDRIASALREHGLMLSVEWAVEGVHFFDAEAIDTAAYSWPLGRVVPKIADDLTTVLRDDVMLSRVVCDAECVQLAVLPLLEDGETAGILLIERALGDVLKSYHLLSGIDVVVLHRAVRPKSVAAVEGRYGSYRIGGVTRQAVVEPVLQALLPDGLPSAVDEHPQRIGVGQDWYEVFETDAVDADPDVSLLLVSRVTDQVLAVQGAITDSVALGVAGLLSSELILLMLLWGPVRRLQDVIRALPLLAERSFAQLRDSLPELPIGVPPRDEIDATVHAIGRVSERIEALDEANRAVEDRLRTSETSLQLAQSMARVAGWSGYPLSGDLAFSEGARRITPVLVHIDTWSEFLALVHPEDRVSVLKAWRGGRPGGVLDVEFRLLLDETEIDIHAIARFDAIGPARKLRASGMMQDVSEMRAAQRELTQHQARLEELVVTRTRELSVERNRASQLAESKSRFLANMSHEIRTPLTAVLGLSQIGMQQSYNRKIAATFQQILTAGDHLLNVVNDVLDLSKLDADRLVIASEPYELRVATGHCVEMFRLRAESKGLQLSAQVSDELPDFVLGDRFRLQQVLINLLGNALKFTDGGEVRLEVFKDSGQICFRVLDTGMGMGPKQLKQLFEPYYQVQDGSQRIGEGTGLGLNISKRITALMGGDIQVYSQLGVGSEFTLRLPLVPASETLTTAESPVPQRDNGRKLDGLRVLLADDVSINRSVVEHLLSLEGALVETAGDGGQVVDALAQGREKEFDVVLMDVEMPGMDGREATRRIRQAGIDLPIIGVTAHVSTEERQASLLSGMQDQLVKPLIQETLVSTILSHVDRPDPELPDGTTLH